MRSTLPVALLFISFAAHASDVVEFSHVALSDLGAANIPEASSPLLSELRECEAARSARPPCGHVFRAGASGLLVELCKTSGSFQAGLYIFRGASGQWFYPWFDSRLMGFSCSERSEVGQETSYYGIEASSDTGFWTMLYRYHINLSLGHVYFRLLPGSATRILDRYRHDQPS